MKLVKAPVSSCRSAVSSFSPLVASGRSLRVCLVLLVALAAGILSLPGAVPIEARRSETAAPARLISLVPAVTEMLFALGLGERMVGVSSFDRFPPEVERVPKVGALLDPDVERILSLRPDLVFIYRSQVDLEKQLGRARIPVFTYAHAGLADVTATIRRVGERTEVADRAESLARSIESSIEAIREGSRRRPRPRTLVVFGRDAFSLRGIYASGGVGFIHDMLLAAGGDNVFDNVKREAVQATTELIIARRPEVILELRADPIDPATAAKELRTWAALSSLPAVQTGRLHIIADPRTVIPGPRVAEGLEVLARALHQKR
jgi:iron complex transport system substrate-binding protein